MVIICGPMVGSILASGKQIKCTDTEYFHGQMANATKDNIIKIKKKVMECFIGLMVVNTKAAGKMENSMVQELIHLVMEHNE